MTVVQDASILVIKVTKKLKYVIFVGDYLRGCCSANTDEQKNKKPARSRFLLTDAAV
jgi:hypothetical protein